MATLRDALSVTLLAASLKSVSSSLDFVSEPASSSSYRSCTFTPKSEAVKISAWPLICFHVWSKMPSEASGALRFSSMTSLAFLAWRIMLSTSLMIPSRFKCGYLLKMELRSILKSSPAAGPSADLPVLKNFKSPLIHSMIPSNTFPLSFTYTSFKNR
ncbi:hypothetical protein WICPIJ_009194 [Wickerhamomyces pijperi]|uniref:Secreted protein n=1 Tax=Wickerhamomyces pijperi TaxID=599730 RepID=A0A9P8TEW0_WICPI|nr:hypothetical protein WICPIJ_009194 [Wickerhamomyces pijperi]